MILQPSSLFNDIHAVADGVAAFVSLPVLYGIIKVVRYTGKIERTIGESAVKFNAHVENTTKTLDDHEDRLRPVEGKVKVLWDGHERREDLRRVETRRREDL